jgi:hypothetical protein
MPVQLLSWTRYWRTKLPQLKHQRQQQQQMASSPQTAQLRTHSQSPAPRHRTVAVPQETVF